MRSILSPLLVIGLSVIGLANSVAAGDWQSGGSHPYAGHAPTHPMPDHLYYGGHPGLQRGRSYGPYYGAFGFPQTGYGYGNRSPLGYGQGVHAPQHGSELRITTLHFGLRLGH